MREAPSRNSLVRKKRLTPSAPSSYGFKHAYIPADVIAWKPAIWPYHKLTEKEWTYVKHADFSTISFGAVLVFHDSRCADRLSRTARRTLH